MHRAKVIKAQCIFSCLSLLQSMHPSNAIKIQCILLQSIHRTMLSRCSVFSVVFRCCSPCTEKRYQDFSVFSVVFLQLQSMYRAIPSRFSVFSVVFCSCSPCTEQCHQDSVYFLLSFAVAAHCTEQCRQDSVYFLLSFAVAAHVPSNAIKIQCIFCCLLQLQPMHPKITCQGIANARWFYHRFYPRYLPEVIIM